MLSVDEEYGAPAIANAEYTYYASPNLAVVENEDYRDYMNDIKDDGYDKMYATEDVHATAYENLPPEKLIMLNNLWEELKSDIKISPAIIIICVAIVICLAGSTLFFGIRKKYRNNY